MMKKAGTGHRRVNGIKIRYREVGEGPAMVFLHGWSLDRSSWRRQVRHFSRRYRTIAYDSRAMGKSGGKNRRFDFTQMVDDLAELLRQLDAERPILCGHSMGGNVILEYAATYPETVAALVAAGTPGPKNLVTSPLADQVFEFASGRLGSVTASPPLVVMLPILQSLFWSPGFQRSDPRAIARWQRQFCRNSLTGLLNASKALAYREDLTHRLHAITAPTLLIAGSCDRIVAREESQLYRHRIPGARLKVFRRAGHTVHEEKPGKFNRSVDTFLRDAGIAPSSSIDDVVRR